VRAPRDRHAVAGLQSVGAVGQHLRLAGFSGQDDHPRAPLQLIPVLPAQHPAYGLGRERERAGGVGEQRDLDGSGHRFELGTRVRGYRLTVTNSGWSSRRSQVPSGCLPATCARELIADHRRRENTVRARRVHVHLTLFAHRWSVDAQVGVSETRGPQQPVSSPAARSSSACRPYAALSSCERACAPGTPRPPRQAIGRQAWAPRAALIARPAGAGLSLYFEALATASTVSGLTRLAAPSSLRRRTSASRIRSFWLTPPLPAATLSHFASSSAIRTDGASRSAASEWPGGGRRGGVEGAVPGRETATKSIVAIAVEIKQPKGFGRIRLHSVDDV
jgi:hypothetical protein